MNSRPLVGAIVVAVSLSLGASAQTPLDPAARALRSHEALVALDRYLETWNSRDAAIWATSLNFPHVRPGPGAFEMTRTPQEYAAGIDFAQTLKTGWHHSEWVSREVLQVSNDKIHAAGVWQRYSEDGKPLASSAITYILTRQDNRWGVQARFAAGVTGIDAGAGARHAADAVTAFMKAWNSHDPKAVSDTLHFPHVRMADGLLEIWKTADEYLAGRDPGRQRTWYQTRIDRSKVVHTTATGANVTVVFSRLGRDGNVLSTDEGVFLVVQRNGVWKLQARSTMGT